MIFQDKVDLIIVGAGPAGLAAAIAARESGVSSLLVLERENEPGGILRQCIHNGFGLHRFSEELTGPEYAWRDIPILSASSVIVIPSLAQIAFINRPCLSILLRDFSLQFLINAYLFRSLSMRIHSTAYQCISIAHLHLALR